MKNLIRSGINKFDKHYAEMEKPARIALRTGLLVVASASLVLLSMLCHAESLSLIHILFGIRQKGNIHEKRTYGTLPVNRNQPIYDVVRYRYQTE